MQVATNDYGNTIKISTSSKGHENDSGDGWWRRVPQHFDYDREIFVAANNTGN